KKGPREERPAERGGRAGEKSSGIVAYSCGLSLRWVLGADRREDPMMLINIEEKPSRLYLHGRSVAYFACCARILYTEILRNRHASLLDFRQLDPTVALYDVKLRLLVNVENPPWVLKFISGKYQGGEFTLEEGRGYVVGRSSECDMVLVEDMISRAHATFSVKEGKVYLRDNGSTNGSFVNGERITEVELSPNDRVLLGTSIIKLLPFAE